LNEAIKQLVDETDPLVLHGYMDNAGYPDVRQAVAEQIYGTIITLQQYCMKVNRQKKKTATGHFPYGYCPDSFSSI